MTDAPSTKGLFWGGQNLGLPTGNTKPNFTHIREDLHLALVAAAYHDAADYVNGLQPGKLTAPDSEWMHADPSKIRARTPADAQAALERIVQERVDAALEEAAQWCDAHQMATPYGSTKPTHLGYFADPAGPEDMSGAQHPGMGYAAAIRAMKGDR